MADQHIFDDLAALADDRLPPSEQERARSHLAVCPTCSEAYEEVRFGMRAVTLLRLESPPEGVWHAVDTELARRQRRRITVRWLAVAAAMLLTVGTVWQLRRPAGPAWEVRGAPSMRSARAGDWIETATAETASVKIGDIGVVGLSPGTRLRIVSTRPELPRLSLASGQIHASIKAPPRLFHVDTAAGTAVDLGCEYDLLCDRAGNGVLRVTQGWVAYEAKGQESLVPAGASCRTRAGRLPGTPVFDDASQSFHDAVQRFDADGGSLTELLGSARPRDTLTLWHLLSRAREGDSRRRIFQKMIAFTPLPNDLSPDRILALDATELRRWREELAWTW